MRGPEWNIVLDDAIDGLTSAADVSMPVSEPEDTEYLVKSLLTVMS